MSTSRVALRLLSLTLLASASTSVLAQQQQPQPAASVAVTAMATEAGLRFAAVGPVAQTRLEVFDASGNSVFNSGLLAGNVRDWAPSGPGGARFPDGTYQFVMTARDVAGRLSLKQVGVVVEGARPSLHLGAAELAGEPQPPEVGSAAGDDEARALTVVAHDGRDGQVTSTTGALTLRTGDLFAGKDREQMRLTPDGRVGIGTEKPEATLDVAGSVRAREGFQFSDGSRLTISDAGALVRLSADGATLPGWSTRPESQTGAALADTVVDGNLVFTNPGFPNYGRDIRLTDNLGGMRIFGAPSLTASPAGAAIQFFGNGHTAFPGQAYVDAGAHNSAAVIFRTAPSGGTIAERMRITSAGNVGIGTNVPEASLHLAGAQPPPAASGPGTNAPSVLKVVGAKGGNAQSQGPVAGTGADVSVQAGAGGDQYSGSAGVRGGNVLLQAGAGGNNPGQHGGPGGSITLQPGAGGSGVENESIAALFLGPVGNVLLAPTAGRVGVGTTTPEAGLHVVGPDGVNDAFSSSEANAPPVLKVVGGKGGSGSHTGNGGAIILQPGASGGTPVYYNDLLLAPAGGSVAVGTEYPFADFHVVGSSKFDGNTSFDGSTNFYGSVSADSLNSSRLEVNNWDTLEVIGPKGVVGIGTDDPEARLHVGGPAVAGIGTVTSSGQSVTGTGTDFNSKLSPGDLITAGGQTRTVGAVNSNTSLTVTAAFSPNISNQSFSFRKPLVRLGDNMMGQLQSIVTADGQFGIGTTSPTATLHVAGTGLFTGNLTVGGTLNATLPTGSGNYIQNNPASQQSGSFNVSGAGTVGGTLTSGGLNVDTNTLHVDAANNRVGVGTSTPESPLHVLGTARAGIVRATINAGAATAVTVGERYRDNALIGWGKIFETGVVNPNESFGITVVRDSAGVYTITLLSAPTNQSVPVAVAEVDAAPTSAAAARLLTIDQISLTQFKVYITNGSFAAVDNDFLFMVTGR